MTPRRLAILAAALAVVAWWLRRPSADTGRWVPEGYGGIQVDVGLLR